MKISVIITTFNAEKYLSETLKSVLSQTHMDFECIICDDGSTDNTLNILDSIHDSRFIVLKNNTMDTTPSLEKAFRKCTGTYIARLMAGDLMHSERLKIQSAILEEESTIGVCGTHTFLFNQTTRPILSKGISGVVENPLIQFLGEPIVYPGTLMYRKALLDMPLGAENREKYSCDLMWMASIAMLGGIFYMESQPLNYQRMIDSAEIDQEVFSKLKADETHVKEMIVNHLISKSPADKDVYHIVYDNLKTLNNKDLLQENSIYHTFRMLFAQNKTLAQGS